MPRSLIPEKYGDPDLSPLTCRIRENQENLLQFDLE
jgi:hypothetical protein